MLRPFKVFVLLNNKYLSSSGGVRICPSQTASNVKIRPRHITTRWVGHGPSLSDGERKKKKTLYQEEHTGSGWK